MSLNAEHPNDKIDILNHLNIGSCAIEQYNLAKVAIQDSTDQSDNLDFYYDPQQSNELLLLAEKQYQTALTLAENNSLRHEMGRSYLALGNICYFQSLFDKALHNYQKADEILIEPNELAYRADIANGCAMVYRALNNIKLSQQFLIRALNYFENAGALDGIAIILANMNLFEKTSWKNEIIESIKIPLEILTRLGKDLYIKMLQHRKEIIRAEIKIKEKQINQLMEPVMNQWKMINEMLLIINQGNINPIDVNNLIEALLDCLRLIDKIDIQLLDKSAVSLIGNIRNNCEHLLRQLNSLSKV